MLPFKFGGTIRTFQDKHKQFMHKQRQFMTTQSTWQKILRYYIHVKKKVILNHEHKEKDKFHRQS